MEPHVVFRRTLWHFKNLSQQRHYFINYEIKSQCGLLNVQFQLNKCVICFQSKQSNSFPRINLQSNNNAMSNWVYNRNWNSMKNTQWLINHTRMSIFPDVFRSKSPSTCTPLIYWLIKLFLYKVNSMFVICTLSNLGISTFKRLLKTRFIKTRFYIIGAHIYLISRTPDVLLQQEYPTKEC